MDDHLNLASLNSDKEPRRHKVEGSNRISYNIQCNTGTFLGT